jgi:hypothetical protein
MIRKTKKTRKYSSPRAWVTLTEFEGNFCNSILTTVEVDQLKSIGMEEKDSEGTYFEF